MGKHFIPDHAAYRLVSRFSGAFTLTGLRDFHDPAWKEVAMKRVAI
jgi:hypothetical protein